MSAIRIFLHIFVINWLANDIRCPKNFDPANEKQVTISTETYAKIIEKLVILEVYDEAKAVHQFESTRKVKSVWNTPEICEWGDNLVKMPQEDNICNIVSVKLSSIESFKSKSATMIKHYKPYECFSLPINNIKSKKLLSKRPTEKVTYCPAAMIYPTGAYERRLTVKRFVIGHGDYRRNSIFVYHLNDHGKSMDLIFYMYNVLTYHPMVIDRDEYRTARIENFNKQYLLYGMKEAVQKFADYYDGPGITRSASHKEISSKTIVQTTCMCEILSVLKFAKSNEREKNAFLVDTMDKIYQTSNDLIEMKQEFFYISKFVDTSGFMPYVSVRRPIENIERSFFLKRFKPNMIFCPEQFIIDVNGRKTYKQPAFLYSAGDSDVNSYFIYDIVFQRLNQKQNDQCEAKAESSNTEEKDDAEIDQREDETETSTSKIKERDDTEIETLKGIKLVNYVTWEDDHIKTTERQIDQITREINGY